MSPGELAVAVKTGLDDVLDTDDSGNEMNSPLFVNVDIIEDEKPVTIGVMDSEGSRFFITIEEI